MSRRKISPVTNTPTPKPLPTPEEQKHRFNRTRFTVAVWWREGVGGQKSFNTLAEARAYAASMKKMGYPKWRTSQVFVWIDTLELIDVIDAVEEPQMITFDYLIEAHSGPLARMCYSSRTTWWTHDVEHDAVPSMPVEPSIPLDPSGCPLFQQPMLEGLRRAEASPESYGEGGLDLFMFTHHQNCGGQCFLTWGSAREAWIAAGRPTF